MSRAPRIATVIPQLGVASFLILYAWAVSLYPGGVRGNSHTQGFSQTGNYWCDLLDETAYSGAHNPGRPFAIAASVLLASSLVVFWWFVPTLFGASIWGRRTIQFAGGLAMIFSMLVGTSLHDLAVNLGALFGVVAFALTLRGLVRAAEWRLLLFATAALAMSLLNFWMWRTRWQIEWMALVQKGAFALFFAWVVATARRFGDERG